MSSAPLPLGVTAPSPAPPQNWPALAPSPVQVPSSLAAADGAWPRAAQQAVAGLLLAALALVGWHLYARQAWTARPTEIEPILRIDLNRADRAELLQLRGIGDKLADNIEAYRREHGPFRSIDELRRVPGIGLKTLERLRPFLIVEPPEDDEDERDDPPAPPTVKPKPDRPATGKKGVDPSRPINVNCASLEELQRLPDIGPARAKGIIAARQKAPFKTINDLRKVPGIGPKILEKLRPLVTVEAPAP
jgi:competence protein ComEA